VVLLELQLGFTRPEDQKSRGLPQLIDDLVIVPVKMLALALLVCFLASLVLATFWRRKPWAT
jgi:hypothetical protein